VKYVAIPVCYLACFSVQKSKAESRMIYTPKSLGAATAKKQPGRYQKDCAVDSRCLSQLAKSMSNEIYRLPPGLLSYDIYSTLAPPHLLDPRSYPHE